MPIMSRIGDYNTQDVKGPPGKLLGCPQPYTTIRVLELPPCFQAGLVQRIQHLGVFTVHCFETHSRGKTLYILD